MRPFPPPHHPPSYGWHDRGPRPPMERPPFQEPTPPEFRYLYTDVFFVFLPDLKAVMFP